MALIPSALKFSGHNAVLGIDGIVLPDRTRGLVARLFERELDMTPLLAAHCMLRLDGAERCLDPERLQSLDDLDANRAVDPQRSEGDASIADMIEMAATTVVAANVTLRASIGDEQLAAAVAATQQAGQQRFTAPYRTTTHKALAIRVVADQALIPLELTPTDITIMVVKYQNLPLAPILPEAPHDPFAAILDGDTAGSPAEHISSSIGWVHQYVIDGCRWESFQATRRPAGL